MKPEIRISSITLPVANLAKSIAFYEVIGLPIPLGLHPKDHIVIELQNNLDIVLQQIPQLENTLLKSSGITLNIIVDQNEDVDAIIESAVEHGGEYIQHIQKEEYDGIYTKYFKDPDGHIWEVSSYYKYNLKLEWAYD
ncbi:VOC family protein [Bacillus sp. JJ1609]|uniref:VOC family protein n=1 Tax=Bacillus sp. JJ1609 TaxID=3122977 RepID=UPI002FFFF99F